jgi:hypothetical protein
VQLTTLNIDGIEIHPCEHAMNLGVIFDQHLNMTKRVDQIIRNSYFELRDIGRMRNSLSMETTKTLVHTLVTSKLDYCNGPPYSQLPNKHDVMANFFGNFEIEKRLKNTHHKQFYKKNKCIGHQSTIMIIPQSCLLGS